MVEIRPETAEDAKAIALVTVAAFVKASQASHTEQFIINALRKAGKLAISLVADSNGAIIGHVAVSPVSVSDGTSLWYGLGPLSVMPGHQGRGIGTRLVNEALRILRERAAAGCVVVGEPKYYRRFGFAAEPGLTFPGVPPEYFQAMLFHSALPKGVVSYHDAFRAKD